MSKLNHITLSNTSYEIEDSYARTTIEENERVTATALTTLADDKEDKVAIETVASGTTTLTAEVNKYYVFAGTVGTLAITLPTPTDATKVLSIGFYMTTGASANVTFSNGGTTVKYYDGFVIDNSTTVEISALFNGSNWVMAYADIN